MTKIAEMDVHFHEMIYMGTKNERLIQLLSNLREQMYRYRMEYIRDEDKRGTLAEEHAEIIRRIKIMILRQQQRKQAASILIIKNQSYQKVKS